MRIVLTNSFLPADLGVDFVLTEEWRVAQATSPDACLLEYSCSASERDLLICRNREIMDQAFSIFAGAEDPTYVCGVSAADIAGREIHQNILLPIAHGLWLADKFSKTDVYPKLAEFLSSVVIAIEAEAPERYKQFERLTLQSFCFGLGIDEPEIIYVHESRNRNLVTRYKTIRDIGFLPTPHTSRAIRTQIRIGRLCFALRGIASSHRKLVTFHYNPTAAFQDDVINQNRSLRLVAEPTSRRQALRMLVRGDALLEMPQRLFENYPPVPLELSRTVLFGTDVSALAHGPISDLLAVYVQYLKDMIPRVTKMMERQTVCAVYVPYETPPHVRLFLRVAALHGLPTFSTTDGYPLSPEVISCHSFAADHALAWSPYIAETHIGTGHDCVTVVGNPAAASTWQPIRPSLHSTSQASLNVLVGGRGPDFSYFNECRSAAEAYLETVVNAITRAGIKRVPILKLHPSDHAEAYRELPRSQLVTIAKSRLLGDLFESTDVFITPESTALFEALASGVACVYVASECTLAGEPFASDPWLQARTAHSEDELVAILQNHDLLFELVPHGWLERYYSVRPSTATDRILGVVRG